MKTPQMGESRRHDRRVESLSEILRPGGGHHASHQPHLQQQGVKVIPGNFLRVSGSILGNRLLLTLHLLHDFSGNLICSQPLRQIPQGIFQQGRRHGKRYALREHPQQFLDGLLGNMLRETAFQLLQFFCCHLHSKSSSHLTAPSDQFYTRRPIISSPPQTSEDKSADNIFAHPAVCSGPKK